ncbi:hypothetical protein N0O92_09895 [Alkalihalobacillus sp. MEB130]|uniref:hypothetical protein n=1 Tax=Alkalihalobacillus sp. MEB130 TaxID=2976704 RepID=UPI0028DE0C18|nr:hypothetical protein [Alkalihalobacillus sp. MEB130]MDT8860546.1 hypothetical protein [Alkalihalobacillus sp. MEB130]
MVNQAFWLVKKELKTNWTALLLTVLVVIFLGLFATIFLEQAARALFGQEVMYYNNPVLDILFVALLPSLSTIFMSGPYLSFQTIKDDPYTKRMAFIRTLPIPVKIVALSRTCLMLLILLLMSIAFFGAIVYKLPSDFYQFVSAKELIIFIFAWFGYSLALGGMNPFIEYGTSGKVLHLVPLFWIGLMMGLFVGFHSIVGYSIVEWSLLLISQYGWIVAVVSIIFGGIGSAFWHKLLTRRLAKRDYM